MRVTDTVKAIPVDLWWHMEHVIKCLTTMAMRPDSTFEDYTLAKSVTDW